MFSEDETGLYWSNLTVVISHNYLERQQVGLPQEEFRTFRMPITLGSGLFVRMFRGERNFSGQLYSPLSLAYLSSGSALAVDALGGGPFSSGRITRILRQG